jgi:hypothetical protein
MVHTLVSEHLTAEFERVRATGGASEGACKEPLTPVLHLKLDRGCFAPFAGFALDAIVELREVGACQGILADLGLPFVPVVVASDYLFGVLVPRLFSVAKLFWDGLGPFLFLLRLPPAKQPTRGLPCSSMVFNLLVIFSI